MLLLVLPSPPSSGRLSFHAPPAVLPPHRERHLVLPGRRLLLQGLLAAAAASPAQPSEASTNSDALTILAASSQVEAIMKDIDTIGTVISLGLPMKPLPAPIPFQLFQRLEGAISERDLQVFGDAAIEYSEYSRDARDLIELARLSRSNGGGPAAANDYSERAVAAIKGSATALRRIVPLLPPLS